MIGREKERKALLEAKESGESEFVAIFGRRRACRHPFWRNLWR